MKRVTIIAKFKGNENDKKTAEMGFKKGEKYMLIFRLGNMFERLVRRWDVVIEYKDFTCPYSSLRTFLENWKITNQKEFIKK